MTQKGPDVTAILNTKGGTGKTTSTANLGAFLATHYRVLLIDMDHQPALSSHFKLEIKAPNGLSEVFQSGSFKDAISKTSVANLDLIYSNDHKGKLQRDLQVEPQLRFRLRNALSRLDGYDYVLIDTQGAVGSALQETSVLTANRLISPIIPSTLAAREFLRGTVDLLNRQREYEALGLKIPPLYGFFNIVKKDNDARSVMDSFNKAVSMRRAEIPTEFKLCKTMVPDQVAFRRAATDRIPVHVAEPSTVDILLNLTQETFGEDVAGKIQAVFGR
jgi:chromosome partitioning related protein ParA